MPLGFAYDEFSSVFKKEKIDIMDVCFYMPMPCLGYFTLNMAEKLKYDKLCPNNAIKLTINAIFVVYNID